MQTAPENGFHDRRQRFLEILVGSMSWVFFIGFVIVSYISVVAAAYILIAYILLWLIKIIGYSQRLTRGYRYVRLSEQIEWRQKLQDLKDVDGSYEKLKQQQESSAKLDRKPLRYYEKKLLKAVENKDSVMNPDDIYHAVVIATYNESPEIVESTIQAVNDSDYDRSKMILILAYEERGGVDVAHHAQRLIDKHGSDYCIARAIEHPADIPGEAKAKAGNITYATRWVTEYVEDELELEPSQVVVTTLDADNRPSRNYFAELAYTYAITPNRVHTSYQPIPMFFNNIWDAPALMRVIAASNSFWVLMECLRPHRLRNFSAHGQSLQTLIDTKYWNVKSIVEDGHQYWRTYFAYKGQHQVLPIFSPIYQDAVLVDGYWRTFKAQFYQLRRWAWGVVDTPYLIRRSFREPDIPWSNKLLHISRQLEGYFSWAVAPIILAAGGWIPLLIYAEAEQSMLAIQLPTIASWIQTGALLGLLAPVVATMASLPKRPARYKRRRSLTMVLQWALVPVALIGFGSHAALNAQTRLMLGKYLGSFNVTEKKRVSAPHESR